MGLHICVVLAPPAHPGGGRCLRSRHSCRCPCCSPVPQVVARVHWVCRQGRLPGGKVPRGVVRIRSGRPPPEIVGRRRRVCFFVALCQGHARRAGPVWRLCCARAFTPLREQAPQPPGCPDHGRIG